jgi:uncharacterized protein (TIGR02687 family)
MASIDYAGAKAELERLFLEQSDHRKIIFWYDAAQNFKENIEHDTFANCRVLINDKNDFAIKKIVEMDDQTSNLLIYVPYERPADKDNWLLDILMYSKEYHADTVELTMRRLGLQNPDFRRVVAKHERFFDNIARVKKLASYIPINDEMREIEFKTAMMATLVKANHKSIEGVLIELFFDEDGSKYNEIKNYGFEDYLWERISDSYNYDGKQSIELLIKKFLMTAMMEQRVSLPNLASRYTQYIIEGNGKTDAKFFVDRLKQDKRYEVFQNKMALELCIEEMLISRSVTDINEADVFECIDCHIIKFISTSLANGSFDYDIFEKVINNRRNSIWFDKHNYEYEFLISVIHFSRIVDKPILSGLDAENYIKNYINEYYKVDYYYRHIIENYKAVLDPYEEFSKLANRIDDIYANQFLSKLGDVYSDALLKKNGQWSFLGYKNICDFYMMLQRIQFKKMFVIISDGLRYEIASELMEEIKKDASLSGSVNLDCAVSGLPSETRFGMASLLPNKKIQYSDKAILVDGMSTNSILARDAILKTKNVSYGAIRYEDINSFSRDQLREYMKDRSLVYIYHDLVDNAGEHNENKVFEVTQQAIKEITTLIKKLYNNLQISNFFVVADHGFIYRRGQIDASNKYGDIVSFKATETSKRFLITDDQSCNVAYTLEFPLKCSEDEKYKVIVPRSYDLYKTQGGGIQYVHGGASLQETIVPILHISELRSSKLKEIPSFVGVRLKTVNRKVTNRSFTLEFEQYEKVEDKKLPTHCITYFIDEEGNKVSGEYKFIADSAQNDLDGRVTKIRFALKNITFNRNNRYYLILKNEQEDDAYLLKEQFVIDILNFKPF